MLAGRLSRPRVAQQDESLNVTMPDSLAIGVPSTLLQRRPDDAAGRAEPESRNGRSRHGLCRPVPAADDLADGGLENDALKGLIESPFSYAVGKPHGAAVRLPDRSGRNTARRWRPTTRRGWLTNRRCWRSSGRSTTPWSPIATCAGPPNLKFNLKEAARQYVVLAKLQYINGVIAIDVLDAQRKFFDAQVEESKAVRNEHLALVGLYKALGGGWDTPEREKKG